MAKIKTKKQPEPKQLPTVTVTSKADPRLKKYQDSLNLYNASVEMGKKGAEALAKDYYEYNLKDKKNYTKKSATKKYKKDVKFYEDALVNPILTNKNPRFGGLYKYDKSASDNITIQEDILKKGMSNYTDPKNDLIEKGYYKQTLKSYEEFKKLNKNIKPVKYLGNAEMFPIPVYKKPVQPVKYEDKVKEAILPTIVLKESDHHDIKIDRYNYDDGEPIMHNSWSGGSELIGVKKKDGKIEYVRPEDYQRMGISKVGQKYIESQTNKNGKD